MAVNKIKTQQIADLAVTTAKIGAQAVTAAKIATGTITGTQLANLAVTNGKVGSNAVTADCLYSMFAFFDNSSNTSVTLPSTGNWAFISTNTTGVTLDLPSMSQGGRMTMVLNNGAGNVTVVPNATFSGTINGAANYVVPPGGVALLINKGSNQWIAWAVQQIPATQLRQSLTPATAVHGDTIQPMTATRIIDEEGEPALAIVAADTCPGATVGLNNASSGAATITPAEGTINGAGSYELAVGAKAWLWSDGGTDWNLIS